MIRVLHEEPAFSEMFLAYVLSRNMRIEEDLVDQLFNSSEKRLARVLLLLAHFGKEGKPEPVVAKISQETLAEMIGTTRSRSRKLPCPPRRADSACPTSPRKPVWQNSYGSNVVTLTWRVLCLLAFQVASDLCGSSYPRASS
jgi:hypothetical protein